MEDYTIEELVNFEALHYEEEWRERRLEEMFNEDDESI